MRRGTPKRKCAVSSRTNILVPGRRHTATCGRESRKKAICDRRQSRACTVSRPLCRIPKRCFRFIVFFHGQFASLRLPTFQIANKGTGSFLRKNQPGQEMVRFYSRTGQFVFPFCKMQQTYYTLAKFQNLSIDKRTEIPYNANIRGQGRSQQGTFLSFFISYPKTL